jgi:hypothetical protein
MLGSMSGSQPPAGEDVTEARLRAIKRGGLPPYQAPATVRVFRWGMGEAGAGRLGLWLGLALVVLGAYLALSPWVPGIRLVGSGLVMVAGLAVLFLVAARRLGSWAVYVGAIVAAVGAAGVLSGAGVLTGQGWTTLTVGLVIVALAAWRASRRVDWRPLAIVGFVAAGLGSLEILQGGIRGFPSAGELVPAAVLVGIGYLVIRNALRPKGSSPTGGPR